MSFATSLFWRHIGRSSGKTRFLRNVLLSECQAKIGYEGLIVFVKQNICRLNVSMHKTLFVSMMKCLSHSRYQFNRVSNSEWRLTAFYSKVDSVNIF